MQESLLFSNYFPVVTLEIKQFQLDTKMQDKMPSLLQGICHWCLVWSTAMSDPMQHWTQSAACISWYVEFRQCILLMFDNLLHDRDLTSVISPKALRLSKKSGARNTERLSGRTLNNTAFNVLSSQYWSGCSDYRWCRKAITAKKLLGCDVQDSVTVAVRSETVGRSCWAHYIQECVASIWLESGLVEYDWASLPVQDKWVQSTGYHQLK